MPGTNLRTTTEMATLFGFAPDEVALNRAGRFSDRQRQTLFFRCIGYLVRGLALIVLNGVLAAAVAPTLPDSWTWIPLAALCTCMLLIALLLVRAAYLTIAHPAIRVFTGSLERCGDDRHPRIRAGDIELRIAYRRWKRLPPACPGQFRFYVGPGRQLLSLEPLANNS